MQALAHVTYHRRSTKYLSTRNPSGYLIFVVKQRASSGVPQGVLLLKVLNFLQHRILLALTFYVLVVVTSFSLTRSILTFKKTSSLPSYLPSFFTVDFLAFSSVLDAIDMHRRLQRIYYWATRAKILSPL